MVEPVTEQVGKKDIPVHSEFQVSEAVEDESLTSKPVKYKLMALLVAMFFSMGSHYATNTLNALKDVAKEELDLTNSDYGIVQSAVFMVNTVMPLAGGVLMDRFGTVYGAVASSSSILLGNMIILMVCYVTKSSQFPLLLTGRIFHGLGSGMIVVAQETILGKWFSNSAMATVIGIQIGASRFSNWAAHATALEIVKLTGSIKGPLWLVVGICFLSWLVTLLYALVLHKAGGEIINKKTPFTLRRLLYLPVGFWIMPAIILILAGIWTPFLGSVADFVGKTYTDKNLSEIQKKVLAGWKSSIALIVPIIVSPLLGGFIDTVGHRSPIIILSAVLTTISLALLTFSQNYLYPGLILFSISLTIGPVALTSSIPLILTNDMIGTGIGVYKSAMSVGITILHLAVGLVQDQTTKKNYSRVMPMLLYISLLGFILTLIYTYFSYHHLHKLLEVKANNRSNILKAFPSSFITESKPIVHSTLYQWLFNLIMFLLVIIAWIFFITMIILKFSITKRLAK